MKKKNLYLIIIITFITLSGFSFTVFDDDFELLKNLTIFHDVVKELRLNYVDEEDSEKLINTAISEMLTSLDPYTVYYPESKIEDYTFVSTGVYAGIGIKIKSTLLIVPDTLILLVNC